MMEGSEDSRIEHVAIFVGLYLAVSLVPYAYFNWRFVVIVLETYYPPDILGLAIWLGGSIALFVGISLLDDGVERYVQFLFWPHDLPAAAVDGAFVWAAASWWALPEIAAYFEVAISLRLYLIGVFLSQLPLLVLLTMLTAVGRATRVEEPP